MMFLLYIKNTRLEDVYYKIKELYKILNAIHVPSSRFPIDPRLYQNPKYKSFTYQFIFPFVISR